VIASSLIAALLAPAQAADLPGEGVLGGGSVQVGDRLEIRYYHFPPDAQLPGFEDRLVQDYVEQVNRLNLLVVKDQLSVGAQVDEVALFLNRYILDDVLYHSWNLYDAPLSSPFPDAYMNLEKVYVERRGPAVDLTLGDTYASFGRGMALNIVKNTDIDIDTSIRGAKAIIHAGKLDLTAVSGVTNEQQVSQDNRNQDITRDPSSMVTGLRGEVYGIGPINAGAHGVIYSFGRSSDSVEPLDRYFEPLDAAVVGASVEAPGLLGIDWFVEGDAYPYLSDDLAALTDGRTGYAVYGSASAYPGRAVVLLELKDTRDTEVLNTYVAGQSWEVSAVPTLEYERVINEDSSAAVNSDDLSGARLRVDYAASSDPTKTAVRPYVSVAAFRDCDTAGLHFNRTPETILHPVAGVEVLGDKNNLRVNGGYRTDIRDDPAGGASAFCADRDPVDGLTEAGEPDRMAHLDSDVHLHLFGEEGLELALTGYTFQWGTNAQQQEDFMEMSNALTWQHGEALAVTLYQDWSDNPLIDSEGNLGDHLYGAAELQWKPTSSTSLRLFYGAYKAGIHCSGGQCRRLPGFDGARLSFSGTL